MSVSNAKTKTALGVIVSVFFFWGFLAASNGIFIPFCKSHFDLTQFQSQLVDSAFYGAYFIGSLLLYLLSQVFGIDVVNKIGYKRTIITGLLISAVASIWIIVAVRGGSFNSILASFFAMAFGFSLQQIAANPFVLALGNPATGTHRLNLAGGVNSFGTTIGPLVVGLILFGSISAASAEVDLVSIDILFTLLAGLFVFVAFLLAVFKMPKVTGEEEIERGLGALKFPQLILGMIAIFMYVGTEVTIQSNMGALLQTEDFGSLPENQISRFISLYWGSLMIGRWTGSIKVFNPSEKWRKILTVIVPFLAFAVILVVNKITGNPLTDLYPYAVCIVVLIAAFFQGNDKPAKTLMLFSLIGVAAMFLGLLLTGNIALYALISGGLMCSIMWPSIFSLATAGLGKYTSQGSGFLIMMILGGAVIPPLQGYIADVVNIHISYIVPALGFGYLAFFAWKVKAVLAAQGIDYDQAES